MHVSDRVRLASKSAISPSVRDRDANKDLVRQYIRACDTGNIARIDELLAPNAAWWILARQDYDRPTIMAINEKRYPKGASRQSRVLGLTAEHDLVAAEFETSEAIGGGVAYSVFHHLFAIADGAIVSCREYLDPPPFAKPFPRSQAAVLARTPDPGENAESANEAETRRVVNAFLGEAKLSPELRAPDFSWWLTGVGSHDLDRYLANLMKLLEIRPLSPLVRDDTRTIAMIVEGNRAAVEVERNVIFSDHDYLDHFHLLFVLRDGKIAEMHEHTDVQAAVRGGLPVLEAIEMD